MQVKKSNSKLFEKAFPNVNVERKEAVKGYGARIV